MNYDPTTGATPNTTGWEWNGIAWTPAVGHPPVASHLDPVLIQVGEIACSQYWLFTPVATVPLRGAQFMVRENLTTQRRIPGYAIVLAILFAALCLIGLLFLLIQEDVTSGSVEVSVTKPDGFSFHTSIPAGNAGGFHIRQQVEYCRDLVRALG